MLIARLKSRLLSCGILLSIALAPQQAFSGVLLQGFYRDASAQETAWWDLLASRANDLRRAGFTAIWLPPVLKGASGGYSTGYDPFDDYDLGSKEQRFTYATRWGTREQLQRSVAIMRANGLDVYVDMVLNHRNGDSGDKSFRYTDPYGGLEGRFAKSFRDFHRDDLQDQDANVPDDSDNFGRDLKHDNPYVSDGLKRAGDWLTKALDIQGYRLDYVKGTSYSFLRDYLNHGAMTGKFAVGEYKVSNRDTLRTWCREQMGGRAAALDFGLRDLLYDMCNGNGVNFDMRRLDHAGLAGLDPTMAVTFVESHDTDEKPNERIISNKHLAYAYILTSEGYPTVFYKDYFDYGMKRVLDNLIWIHEKIAAGPTSERWKDDDVFAFERTGGARLLAALNDNQASDRTITVDTGFGANIQLHDYTGHKGDVSTDGNGRVTITVPKNSYVAYSRLGLDADFEVQQYRVTQEFAGANDLDIKPADNTQFVQAGRIYAQAQKEVRAELYYETTDWTADTRIELEVDSPTQPRVATLRRTAADTGVGKISFVPSRTGWHTFRIRSYDTPGSNSKPAYWLKVSYIAPQKLE